MCKHAFFSRQAVELWADVKLWADVTSHLWRFKRKVPANTDTEQINTPLSLKLLINVASEALVLWL